MDFLASNMFLVDYSLGTIIFALVLFLYLTKRMTRFTWNLFWIGVLLGFTWEFSCNLNMVLSECCPVAHFIKPLPTHFMVIVTIHSLWDGGLFIAGVWLVKKICTPPWFERFRISELAVLLVWGQVQELSVELVSVFGGGWEWIPYWWNPSLFMFRGYHITLLPQLIWFVAPIIFYIIAVRFRERLSSSGNA